MNQLSRILQTWISLLRLQRGFLWAVRGLAFGLGFALLIGGIALLQKKIIQDEFLFFMMIFPAVFSLLFGLVAALWRIRPLEAARRFDLQFGLGERISTALELNGVGGELAQKQLDDALRFARKVKPARAMPLRFKKMDGALAILFALSCAALFLRGESLFAVANQQREVEIAIAQQQSKIEEILKAIEENDSLSDAQKQALSEPLQNALNDLQKTETLEGAVSALTTTGEKMQALSAEQGGETMQSLQQAGSSLAAQEGSPLESVGKDLANGNFATAAAELANMDLSQMSAEELNQLAAQLDSMAESLASSNPQMAQDLQNAADEIRAGDMAAAQEFLQGAAQSMAQVAQQAAASQAASQAAGELSAGAQQLLAVGGGQQALAQQGQGEQGGAGSGSGSGDAPDSNQPGAEAGTSPIPQNNGAGDGGESVYEQIYAPPLLGGSGGDTLGLPTSGDEGEVIGESPATATDGQSLVPYTEVYGQYETFNNQAIDNGEVPQQFLDLIRSYFDSIQP